MDVFFQFQIAVNLFFQQLGDVFLAVSRFFSFLGDENFYFLFMPILYWCVDTGLGMRVGAMLLISNSVVGGLKTLFHWPRPFWTDGSVVNYVNEHSFGFPSGHSANAASVWGVLAAQLKKKWIWVLVIFSVFMIGVSRLAMGVHFLVDVLGGWTIGIVMALLFIKYEKPVARWFSGLRINQQYLVAVITSLFVILPEFLFSWL
ncbi:MAG: phosphatase PAP2 family protein, partial [Anaerolineaceae bacterium]